MIRASESIKEIATALNAAQSEIHGATKNSANPFFKSSYADLESVLDAIREPMAKNGLSYVQLTALAGTDAGGRILCLVTRIMHKSGEWIEGEYPITAAKANDPQAQGSAMTYARRYALTAALGVVQVDDDAEGATDRSKTQQRPAPAPRQPPPRAAAPADTGQGAPPRPDAPRELTPAELLKDPLSYRIKFKCNYQGKQLREVPAAERRSFANWYIEQSAKTGKPLTGPVKEFVDMVQLAEKQK